MRLYDLLRNVEPEPRIVAERFGAVRIEAPEYLFQVFLPDSGALVFDTDLDLIVLAQLLCGDVDRSALWRKRYGVLDQVHDDLAQPAVVAVDIIFLGTRTQVRRGVPLNRQHDVQAGGTVFACDLAEHIEQARHVHRPCRLPGQLRVEPGGIGNVGDEPVQPPHVVNDDVSQLFPVVLLLDRRQQACGVAQRGERVLEFVGDIGGEAFDRVEARIKRVGHVSQRSREIANLVRPVAEVGNLLAVLDVLAHPLGCESKAAHGFCDRARQVERKQRRYRNDQSSDGHDLKALLGDEVVDGAALRGHEQRTENGLLALNRHGDGDYGLPRFRDADELSRAARQRHPHLVIGFAVGPHVLIDWQILGPEAALEIGPDFAQNIAFVLGGPLCACGRGARVKLPAIRNQRAFGVENPGPGSRWADKVAQHRRDDLRVDPEGKLGARQAVRHYDLVLVVGWNAVRQLIRGGLAGLSDSARDNGSLRGQAFDPRFDKLHPVLVDIENTSHEDGNTGQIQDDDPPSDAIKS